MKHPGKILAFLVSLALGLPAHAEETGTTVLPKFTAKDMVRIVNGPNWIDLDGDGHKDLVVKSRVSIFGTPHSYSIYSFFNYINRDTKNPETYEPNWNHINIIDKYFQNNTYGDSDKSTYEGEDCIIIDYRLAIIHNKSSIKTWLIQASRELGNGFWDEQPYTFTYYELDNDEDPQNGYVRLAFIKKATSQTTKKYCGANEAFHHEFGFKNPEATQDKRR